jgi:hypothetical protein
MTREACDPYIHHHPESRLSLGDMLGRLTRDELETLVLRFYGRNPGRFEELLLELWQRRQPPLDQIAGPSGPVPLAEGLAAGPEAPAHPAGGVS